ncbi:hypothetical protein ACFL1K_01740 [Candidatus Omnitrophota bacterium]
MNRNSPSEGTLVSDKQWSVVESEVCRATNFDDTATIQIECRKIPHKIKGFISHKEDLMHLREAFDAADAKKDLLEVLVIWTKTHYKNGLFRLMSFSMPKLIVWVCKKGAYEFINYPAHKPELQGEARFEMQKPVVEFKPGVMG